MEKTKDFLWNGIPAVFYSGKYIIFSPYSKKIITLKEKELNNKKIFEKLKKENFFGKPSRGQDDRLSVTLYLTDDCMLNCIYCFDDCGNQDSCAKQLKQSMNPKTAINSLHQVIKNHKQFFPKKQLKLNMHFFGGEPTLNMNTIREVVKYLEDRKIDTTYWISTNGVTSEENIKFMISKNFRFDIDCDGKPEVHDSQRPFKKGTGKSSFFAERIIKLLVKHNAKIRTKVVVTNNSIEKMPESVEYLADLGINHIRLEALLIDGRAEKGELKSVEPEKFVKYFLKATEKAKELSKKYNRRIYVSNWAIRNIFEPRDYFCHFVRGNRIAIMPDGTISKCVRNLHSEASSPFIVGKLDEKGIYIDKEKMNKLRNLSVEKMPKCKNCFAKYICSGGCFNENFKSNFTFEKPNKIKCELAKKLIKALIIEMYKQS